MPSFFTKILVVVLLWGGCALSARGQAVETYRVKKSDTMQTVADRFGMSVEELLEYNREYRDPSRTLQARDILVIPSKKERKIRQLRQDQLSAEAPAEPAPVPTEFFTHVVAPKETVYGISHRWGITQEQLLEYNPELKTSVLKIGMSLRIPSLTPPAASSQPSPAQTSASAAPSSDKMIADAPAVSSPAASGESRRRKDKSGARSEERIEETREKTDLPVAEPLDSLSKTVSALPARELDVRRMLKVDVMLPFYLDRFDSLAGESPARRLQDSQIGLGFYMGVRMALDSLAGQGLIADVRVFDTRRDTQVVDSLLRSHDFSATDVVIGPLFAEVAQRVSDGLKGGKTIVVSPLSIRHNIVESPNILQVSAPAQDLQEAVLRYMRDNISSDARTVIFASSTGQGVQIEKARRALAQAGKDSVLVLDTDLGENAARLAALLKPGADVTVLAPSLTASVAAEVYQAVDAAARLDPVDVYAFEANSAAKKLIREAQSQAASRVRYIYADRTFEDTEKARYQDFARAFRLRYHEFPGTYSLAGFDITYDLLSRLACEADNETALTSYPSEQVVSRYRFIKYLDGGYVNTDAYILMHDTDHGTVLLY